MALDFDTLYNEASSGAVGGGKKRYYDNRVHNINVFREESGKTVISALVRGEKTEHVTRIIFDEQGGLYDYSCDCEFLSSTDGPCKHVVAAALAFEEKNPSLAGAPSGKKSVTSPAALTLISDYAKKKNLKARTLSETPVRLLPTVCLENGKIFLMLSVGREKTYLVRDVSDFVSGMQSGSVRRYGVDLTLTHSYEYFDPLSAALARFVVGCYKEKAELGIFSPAKNLLPLPGGDLDEFFDLYASQMPAFNDGNVKNGLRLLCPDVNAVGVTVTAASKNGGYEFSSNLGPFKTVSGKNYSYMITDTRIFRLDGEFSSTVMPLLSLLCAGRTLNVSVPDMPLFYNNVITPITKFLPVDSGDCDLTVFEAAPLVAKLMLSPGDKPGTIVAKPIRR